MAGQQQAVDLTDYRQPAWSWLQRELDRWLEVGMTAEFWWRDDDAVEPSPQLEKLIGLSSHYAVPLALAVIPAKLKSNLADQLSSHPQISILQHGYAHINHASAGQRKLELGGVRNKTKALQELKTGLQQLRQAFANKFNPVLVPPWNRIDSKIVAQLPGIGFRGISTMKVCKNAYPSPGLKQVNTHLDPINWRHRQGYIGDFPAIAILLQHLISKRTGYRNAAEPTGLLTHHLVQNERVWEFVESLLQFLNDHPATCWRSADSIWE